METCTTKDIEPTQINYFEELIDAKIQEFIEKDLDFLIDKRLENEGTKPPEPLTISVESITSIDDYIPEPTDKCLDKIDGRSQKQKKSNTDSKENKTKVVFIENENYDKDIERHTSKEQAETKSSVLPNSTSVNLVDTDDTYFLAYRKNPEKAATPIKHSDKKNKPRNSKKTESRYTNKEVADQENLTTESIRRYRSKIRSPRDKTFFDRWEYDTNELAWVKLNKKPLL